MKKHIKMMYIHISLLNTNYVTKLKITEYPLNTDDIIELKIFYAKPKNIQGIGDQKYSANFRIFVFFVLK